MCVINEEVEVTKKLAELNWIKVDIINISEFKFNHKITIDDTDSLKLSMQDAIILMQFADCIVFNSPDDEDKLWWFTFRELTKKEAEEIKLN